MKNKENIDEYLDYPASDDIYNKAYEEQNIDPEDISKLKESVKKLKDGENNEKDFAEDISGDDLDISGSEIDDEDEVIGSEDEENNYYSIGGDNHNDLDENSNK
jgi:hypothetical protein